MNVLIYPGTFDPIHRGHIDALRGAMREKDYDKIYVLLQTNRFKNSTMFTYEARLQFIIDALNLNDMGKVDVIETDSPYLYDALQNADVFTEIIKFGNVVDILVGDDTMTSIEKWFKFDIIKGYVRFVVVQRLMTFDAIYATANRIFNRFNIIQSINDVSTNFTSTGIRYWIGQELKDFMWKSKSLY